MGIVGSMLELRSLRLSRRGACAALRALISGAAALALVACRGDHAASAYEDMLSVVPHEPGISHVLISDIARFREVAGIEVPDRELDDDTYLALLNEAKGIPPVYLDSIGSPGTDDAEVDAATRQYLGFGLKDVDQWLIVISDDWSEQAPDSERRWRSVLRGSFRPGAVDELLDACGECPPADQLAHQGTVVLAWDGEAHAGAGRSPRLPVLDSLGEGCCIAMQDRYVLRGYSQASVRAMLDAQAGSGSLAGDENFRLAAEALDEVRPLRAFLQDSGPDRAFAEDLAERMADTEGARTWFGMIESADDELLRPYVVRAYGPGYDDGEHFTAIVLVHASAEAARANADRLPRRLDVALAEWSEDGPGKTWGERFHRIEVEVDGRVLRARFWSDRAYLHDLYMEPLFLHE